MIAPHRLAAGPISWGVCEVPGWGIMLPPDRVLGEMRALGLQATELGAPGFLPGDPEAVAAVLAAHEMTLVGAFVPVVLHDPAVAADTRRAATATADHIRRAGGTVFVSTVVADAGWATPWQMSDTELDHVVGMLAELDAICAERGMIHALHPHVGTLVERADDVRRLLDRSDVGWCLDTGHLFIGGYDPVEFAADAAGRVAHVHLKDVDASVAGAVRAGELSIQPAVQRGLFLPLGRGEARVAETIAALEGGGYDGWYVLEQDTDLGETAPPPGSGPIDDARISVEFLTALTVTV